MDRQALKELQAHLKELYQQDAVQAVARLHAAGYVDMASLTCRLTPPPAINGQTVAGLHPKAGGDGSTACSGDMLLQALVSCAGVTLAAVATSMVLDLKSASIEASGEMDFRGTLGVSRDVPIGITSIELSFKTHGDLTSEQREKLVQLVERYCVVLQTLKSQVAVTSRINPQT